METDDYDDWPAGRRRRHPLSACSVLVALAALVLFGVAAASLVGWEMGYREGYTDGVMGQPPASR